MKQNIHFEVVLVVERFPNGMIKAHYPGDEKLSSEREARALAVTRRKEYPDSDYAVVRITMAELPK